MSNQPEMHLMVQIGHLGNHIGGWRRPASRVEEAHRLPVHADAARWAEAAKLDAVFIADGLMLFKDGSIRYAPSLNFLEPLTLLSAIATQTTHIGLISTVSTSFTHPYNVARQFASLDHLSGGRAGWNIVTSWMGETNFGLKTLPEHDQRYARAAEHLQVASALWDSWKPGSLIVDRSAGVYADNSLVTAVNHSGEFFDIEGPLNISRSPQGRPVFVQAGSSEHGRDLAARSAEVVFTAQQTVEGARAFYQDIKSRAVRYGRSANSIKVLTGVSPVIGSSDAEAAAINHELNGLIDEQHARNLLSTFLGGVDLSPFGLDDQLPEEFFSTGSGRHPSRVEVYRKLAVEEHRTLRELLETQAAASGHWSITGGPERIAEQLIDRFDQKSTDGFIILPSYFPEGLQLITDEVVPILQQRGYFRTEYSAATLRGHLGLDDVEY